MGKTNAKQSQRHGENHEGDHMIYKGQKLSDNLTQSQINMYKHYIDKGFTMEQIMTMFHLDDRVNKVLREPDLEE